MANATASLSGVQEAEGRRQMLRHGDSKEVFTNYLICVEIRVFRPHSG